MGKYIVKRILQVIPMLFILSLIVFMMVRLIPGDPVDMMLGMDIPKDTKEYERERLGLNDPLYIQYFRFVGNALHGDLGTSIFSGKPVVEELAKRFPKTLTLAVGGTLFGAAVGVLLAGATLVETVFSIPGIGRFVVDSVSNRDYPAIQGAVLVLAVTFVLVNTLVDLLYAAVDPRVKYD